MSGYALKIGYPTSARSLVAEAGSYALTGRNVDLIYSGTPADNDGLVLSDFGDWDPDAAQIISLDVNSTIPNWGTYNGGSVTFANETWWNGASVPVATMRPPTISDSGSGFGAIDLWKNATKTIRQINIRWEYRVSDLYCQVTNYPKLIILRTYTQLQSVPTVAPDRPMMYYGQQSEQGGAIDIDDTIFLCPAQGTLRYFSSTNPTPAHDYADRIASGDTDPGTHSVMHQPFYHAVSAGTDSSGNPILAASEIVCVEMRVNVMATSDEPAGVIGQRVYRRNGAVYERVCAWRWDENKTVDTNYIADIDTWGGGYYNGANNGDTNLWTKIGRKVTFAFNYNPTVGRSWIGPPTGFVT